MKAKRLFDLVIASLMVSVLWIGIASKVPRVYAQRRGAQTDVVRLMTVKSPVAQLFAMQTGQIDFLPDLIRPDDIETLVSGGHLVTATPGLHVAFVGFNLHRPVLDNVNFRHALFHAYDQYGIVDSIYDYAVTPHQSLVPPAQGPAVARGIPQHPYNPGDSTDTPGTQSTFGILKGAGYVYHGTGYGDLDGWWEDSSGDPLPTMTFYTPTYQVAPTEAEHAARIVDEWHRCGLRNIVQASVDSWWSNDRVFNLHSFDLFMASMDLDQFPLQLWELCHSSEYMLGSDHAVGLQDPILDSYLETLKYSLDYGEQLAACHQAQRRLYNPDGNPWGLPYMVLYSRNYFNAVANQLGGTIEMEGYGSDNRWSWLSWHWETVDGNRPGTSSNYVVYCNSDEAMTRSPVSSRTGEEWNTINGIPVSSTTTPEWNTIRGVFDSLLAMNPYTHEPIPWQADSWIVDGPLTTTITLDSDIDGGQYAGLNAGDSVDIIDGMKITFNLTPDLHWQDGHAVDAGDCEFSLEFLRDNEIPRWSTTWQDIVDVQAVDADTFEVYANETSQFLLYYWADAALLLPPQVWSTWDGAPLAAILAYAPTTDYTDTGPWSYPDGPDGVPGTGDDPDPINIGPKTCLFGTGPLVFDFYDPIGMVTELHNWDAQGANAGYFLTADEIHDLLVELFHAVGDVNRNGWVWGEDQNAYGLAFGSRPGAPNWNPDADLNHDDRVNFIDGAIIKAYFGRKMYA